MLNTYEFGQKLKNLGFSFYSGVPCSFLNSLINYAINECNYIMSANEGDAVATCSGAALTGQKSVVLMQNSGLGNAISPLTSLNYIFKIPILGFISLRGDGQDEPQHELMGEITTSMLSLIKVKWELLNSDFQIAQAQLKKANEIIEKDQQSFFFIVKKNTFDKVELKTLKTCKTNLPSRKEALEIINKVADKNTIVLATTGKTGRELYEIEDKNNNFYMVGSMGCLSSLSLGISLNSQKKVIAIDGDAALLMRMGNIATNGFYKPANMCHILLDNNAHDSTGGQKTVSNNINFVSLFKSIGYKKTITCENLHEFEMALLEWLNDNNRELTFIYLQTALLDDNKDLSRPKIKPPEVKQRLMEYIKNE